MCRRLNSFFFNDTATTEIYTLSLHDALPISSSRSTPRRSPTTWGRWSAPMRRNTRSEEHTSELQSQFHLVCRLLLEKKKDDRTHAPNCADIQGRPLLSQDHDFPPTSPTDLRL